MIVTEEEAKTKLCPEAIGLGDINWVMVPTGRMCIGSDCMAWRWGEPELIYDKEGRMPENDPGPPWRGCSRRISQDRWSYWVKDAPARGYCGKAGKP